MANLFKCPDCEATFEKASGIGPHRNKIHGFRISDGKNDPKRTQAYLLSKNKGHRIYPQQRGGSFPCPHCDFVASWTGGLKHHMNKKHKAAKKEKAELAQTHQNAQTTLHAANGNAPTHDDGNHRLEAAATFAAGRITQLLEGIALQHDLPAKSLAALVLRVVHAQTVR